ncbi:MAG: 50S ribosomal protein L25 [Candidatus Omnitrophica bacterium CG22_combo_CG10-13_8_21_14_all_43_16]|nr:MAG: 50S ribosomal protein L25 [Candidatus Omnitrophica bacterium CG22_combo_CG10-13_8_21_14_all_43_16]
MDFVELKASLREEKGKEKNKKLRTAGLVPGVVYRKGEATLSLKVDSKSLSKALHTDAGENVIIKLFVEGDKKKKERIVVIKELQRNPFKDTLVHLDLNEISLTETLKVKVPLMAKGEAIGVKQEDGVLQHVMWEVEVECLPTNIPDKIEVDITNLKIGGTLSMKDILPPEGVKILGDPESIIFSVEHVKTVEEAVAAPAEGEALEPELIREKKEKEEAEEEAKAEAPKAEKKEEKK